MEFFLVHVIAEAILLFNRKTIWLATSLFLLLLLSSCNDDPTSIGANLLPAQDMINVIAVNSIDSTISQKVSNYDTDTLALNSSSKILLGEAENVKSVMLMKFYMFLADSIKEAILDNSIIIKSATLELKTIYTYGNPTGSFDFSIYEITEDWNSLEFGKEDLPINLDKTVDLSSNEQISDSLVTLDFNKDILFEWMKFFANGTQAENYGIYFDVNSGTDRILGFPAISSIYDSTIANINMVIEVPNKFTDTLDISVTSDLHIVLGNLEASNKENVIVQGGIPTHANLFFDLSAIPNHAIVNRATLKLFVDDSETEVGSIESKYLNVILLDNFEDSEVSTAYPRIVLNEDSLRTFYSGEITPFVQYWISKENNGAQLYLNDEIETVNKIAIATDKHANPALKPYLEIIYTSKN